MDPEKLKHYLADSPPSVVPLSIGTHFSELSQQEQLYAHYISVAAFSGVRIVLRQISPESEGIYDLIITLYNARNGDWKALQKSADLSDDELSAFLDYSAQFLGNNGNYKSFGDSKFIPRLDTEKFRALAAAGGADQLYDKVAGGLYAGNNEKKLHMGYPEDGHVSTYYPDSPDITTKEITAVSDLLSSHGQLPENQRLRKTADGNFQALIASALSDPPSEDRDMKEHSLSLPDSSKHVSLLFGDHQQEMAKASAAMALAAKSAGNETEKKMMEAYSSSFKTGSLEEFKNSQRLWIQDKGPNVETNIGFIETYRDPHGIRGEWEGFVAMVNKERTRVFSKLVDAAPVEIPKLPWSKDFEKDKFLRPDFTSLEVLTFAGSGVPAGINIPNYDDIRQTLGFKNVSLGNVLSAKAPTEVIPFIAEEDLAVYTKNRDPGFEVQVGLHELFGHGCGKLLQETSPGQFNFDKENPPTNPITGKPVDSWYKPNETWGSVFGAVASSYEECRAECVAIVLACEASVLEIYGLGDGTTKEAEDVLYIVYLSMARAGLLALEYFDPGAKKWGQIHMQARFAILQVLLDAGDDFCVLKHKAGGDLSDLTISIDRSKIRSHGRPAVERFLQQLAVYKATADVKRGTELYNDFTQISEGGEWKWWIERVRPVVLAKKQPRKVFVQANTVLKPDGTIELKEYEASPEGMIKSFAERTYI